MFKHYLKLSFRNLKKQKLYTIITTFGLALGLACTMIILLYVQNELRFDQFHVNKDRIYRLTGGYKGSDNQILHFARCSNAWGEWITDLKNTFPEIQDLVRLTRINPMIVQIGDSRFREKNFYITEPSIFNIFSLNLIMGDPNTALQEPHSMVITESLARKYFGTTNPMGQSIITLDGDKTIEYKITGMMQDFPPTSHIDINMLVSFSDPNHKSDWAYIYLLLKDHAQISNWDTRITPFIKKNFGDWAAQHSFFHIQRLTDIHLHSQLDRELKPNGSIAAVYTLFIVAFLIIIIACINYINLTTVRSEKRAKEIGIHKIIGSQRSQLIFYLLCETMVVTFCAFALSILFIQLALPWINTVSGQSLQLDYLHNWPIVFAFIGVAVLTGLISGIFPAWMLSKSQPVVILKHNKIPKRWLFFHDFSFRKILVIIQFSVSIILIIASILLKQQMLYLKNKDLGFSKGQVISLGKDIPFFVKSKYEVLKNALSQVNGVIGVTASMDEPAYEIKDGGQSYVEGKYEGIDRAFLYILSVDQNYIPTMNIQFLCGNNFIDQSYDYNNLNVESNRIIQNIQNAKRTYILNETAVKSIGWQNSQDAIGKQINWQNSAFKLQTGPIVGVVKDFNISTLHKKVIPIVMVYEPVFLGSILVKLHPENIQATIKKVQKTWENMFPQYPFEFSFLDDLFAQLYQAENQFDKITTIFTIIAIIIACLGLYALSAFSVEQRTKEMSIRKILGASIPEIFLLFNRDFTKCVLIANIIAWPVIYYAMNKWLQNFAYRIEIAWWVFILSGGIAILIALITVSYQAVKVALANPVESLRYE
ncbi:MAG TPA: FtsX-like permease family protein [Ignavibacteriaceae bacterium]|nr:FtsX-like permease family protein [Ignavibacteriaceae bacterium]